MRLLILFLCTLLCATGAFAQAPGVGIDSFPSASTPLNPNSLLPAYQPGSGGVGALACARGWCPVSITPLQISSYVQSALFYAPSGDTTGATDAASINALLTAGKAVQLQCNATYYVNATITVGVPYTSLLGCGQTTSITVVGVSGPIVYVNAATVEVGKFSIGGTGTNALKAFNSYQGTHIHDIFVGSGGSWVDVFWFGLFFGDQVDNLSIGGVPGSASDFHFDGAVNADTFNNLYTAASFTSGYNFKFQDDSALGPSTGDTFNGLTAQGGTTGFYFGYNFSQLTLNSPYTEWVVFPMIFGNVASSYLSSGITINAPYLIGPDPIGNAGNGYANRVALLDFENASGITINNPNFLGSYLIDTYAQLAFSGGGCTGSQTHPTGIARVSPTGVVDSVMLEFPGSGCTSAPSVAVNAGIAGSGATVTATCCTGGLVTALTLTAGGSGYSGGAPGIKPMPVIFGNAGNIVINAPNFNSGLGFGLYPWIVKRSTAGTTSGISVYGDSATQILTPLTGYQATADLLAAPNFANTEYLRYINGSGVETLFPVTPPNYP